MTAAEYLAVAKVAFKVPINPTADPVMVKASRLESSENLRLYELAKKDFRIYHDVDKALRNQLIAATPDTYLQELRDPDLGYANTSCLEIITHLRDTYGEIAQEDLDANQQRMTAKWHPPTPIEDLFEQLRAGAAFALEGGDTLPPASVVRLGYTILLQTAQAAPPPAVPAARPAARPALADMGYCWSHGYSGNVTHTSATCVHPAEGHQVEATHANKLGGTDRIWTRADRRAPR
eukprot:scaffold35966_cov68-Attheya_sp.AAC.1